MGDVNHGVIPLEALQYPQSYNLNTKLKRTYHVKRDRRKLQGRQTSHRRCTSDIGLRENQNPGECVDLGDISPATPPTRKVQVSVSVPGTPGTPPPQLGSPTAMASPIVTPPPPPDITVVESDQQQQLEVEEESEPQQQQIPQPQQHRLFPPLHPAGERRASTSCLGIACPTRRASDTGDDRRMPLIVVGSAGRRHFSAGVSQAVVLSGASSNNNNNSRGGVEGGQVKGTGARWAEDFDLLLADPRGIRLFTEFLEKEFSAENIRFWMACQEYKKIKSEKSLLQKARDIYVLHLAGDATEPVNVDSGARQTASEDIRNAVRAGKASKDIFSITQKQIYNLMKMDSYPRFLQSTLCKEFLEKEAGERKDPSTGMKQGRFIKKKESDGKRWNLPAVITSIMAGRSKSRERVAENSDPALKRTISSPDIAIFSQNCPNIRLCRVVLPDKSVAILSLNPFHTVGELVTGLLIRRGEVERQVTATTETGRLIDLDVSSEQLDECTITLEWLEGDSTYLSPNDQ